MAGKPLTKAQLVSKLSGDLEMTKVNVNNFLEQLNKIAMAETKKSGQFTLPGIGKLVKSHRKARMGRNPQTGEAIKIPAKTVVKFRVAKACKDSIIPPKK
ncbi:MAG: HU family DNA-binding protein [candidate division Zixibacteria bacterium]|nr:HU family DNA-binding protein [candidate division Zixibacteria bacterium]MBU1471153.1 HU family DNA-binding protein [candidate division Zixibacteria bacterium]MBU2625857.1 HU family DNA-binding protein [candidate division Zixibacteria bacterium]